MGCSTRSSVAACALAISAVGTCACSSSHDAASAEPKGPYESATVLASGLSLPERLFHDASTLFFSVRPAVGPDAVYSLPEQGGSPTLLAGPPAEALALGNDQLYFEGADGIDAMPESGGNPTLVTTSPESVVDIAVDASGVYWSDQDSEGYGQVLAFTPGSSQPIKVTPMGNSPDHIALDADAVYWVAGGGVLKAPKTGGSPEVLATFSALANGIALDDGYVYWPSLDKYGSVRRVSKSGGSQKILVQGIDHPRKVAVDATHVYFTAEGEGTVKRVPKAGGAVEQLAVDQDGPSALALSDDRVFWANRTGGTIATVSK